MKVGLLTIKQKNKLINKEFKQDSLFNPIQDINGKWVISVEEIQQCTNENFVWVKDLLLIDFEPKKTII